MSMADDNVIVVEAVKKHFQSRQGFLAWREKPPIRAVDGVSFAIPRGSCFAIVGESGSGKSTLARLVVGLLRPSDGEVWLDGEPLSGKSDAELRVMRRKVQLVLQDPLASLDPRMTVQAILREALVVHGLHRGRERQQARINEVVGQVGLSLLHLGRYPNELSGGQRQRVAIARAIICEPEVLVLDEPVSALDVSVQAQIINLLVELQEELGLTYVIITHDLSLVGHMADAVGVMYLGRFVERGPARSVCRAPLHPYTRSLLSVVASVDPALERGREVNVLQGSVPSASAMPSGCTFHTRCPEARRLAAAMAADELAPAENGAVPKRCAARVPEVAQAPGGVAVACHFAPAASMSAANMSAIDP